MVKTSNQRIEFPYTIFESNDSYETIRLITGAVILPVAASFGMVTNIFNMAVLYSEGLTNNTNNLSLFSLGLTDFLLCAVSSVTYSDFFFGSFASSSYIWFLLHQYNFLFRTVFLFYQVNLYTVVKIVLERYIAIRFPFKSRQLLTVRRSVIVILSIWVVSLGTHLWFFPMTGSVETMIFTTFNTSITTTSAVITNITTTRDFHQSYITPRLQEAENSLTTSTNVDSTLAPQMSLTTDFAGGDPNTDDIHEITNSNSSILWTQEFYSFSALPAPTFFFTYFIQPGRILGFILVSVCSVGMIVELRKQASRRREMAGHDSPKDQAKKGADNVAVTDRAENTSGNATTARAITTSETTISDATICNPVVGNATSRQRHTSSARSTVKHRQTSPHRYRLHRNEVRNTRVALGISMLFIFSCTESALALARTSLCVKFHNCQGINYNPIQETYYLITQTTGIIFTVGSSCTFILYMVLNRRFRNKFLILFCLSHSKRT